MDEWKPSVELTRGEMESVIGMLYYWVDMLGDNTHMHIIERIEQAHAELYDPEFGDDHVCKTCDHSYYRHFDSYENMMPVGCKYCECGRTKTEDFT